MYIHKNTTPIFAMGHEYMCCACGQPFPPITACFFIPKLSQEQPQQPAASEPIVCTCRQCIRICLRIWNVFNCQQPPVATVRQVAASQESPNKPYWMQAPKNKSPRSGHAHPGSWDNTSAGMQSNSRFNAIHRGSIGWFLNFMIITCPY